MHFLKATTLAVTLLVAVTGCGRLTQSSTDVAAGVLPEIGGPPSWQAGSEAPLGALLPEQARVFTTSHGQKVAILSVDGKPHIAATSWTKEVDPKDFKATCDSLSSWVAEASNHYSFPLSSDEKTTLDNCVKTLEDNATFNHPWDLASAGNLTGPGYRFVTKGTGSDSGTISLTTYLIFTDTP